MPRLVSPPVTALALALVAGGCGAPPARLQLSVELSDQAFCPGGKQVDPGQGDERVKVAVGIRARGRAVLELDREPLQLKVYPEAEPLQVARRLTVPVTLRVGETWRRPTGEISFPPPDAEGRYVLEVSSADGAWVTTPFEVWHDTHACPKPGAAPVRSPAPAVPAAVAPPAKRSTPLEVELTARWKCNAQKGVEDLEVTARVENPKAVGRALRGYLPRVTGIDELEEFERVGGETPRGYLRPGTAVTYRAFGWIETGPRPIEVGVLGDPAPLVKGVLEVDCRGGAGTEGEGRLASAP